MALHNLLDRLTTSPAKGQKLLDALEAEGKGQVVSIDMRPVEGQHWAHTSNGAFVPLQPDEMKNVMAHLSKAAPTVCLQVDGATVKSCRQGGSTLESLALRQGLNLQTGTIGDLASQSYFVHDAQATAGLTVAETARATESPKLDLGGWRASMAPSAPSAGNTLASPSP